MGLAASREIAQFQAFVLNSMFTRAFYAGIFLSNRFFDFSREAMAVASLGRESLGLPTIPVFSYSTGPSLFEHE
jgi:hypothetical protein